MAFWGLPIVLLLVARLALGDAEGVRLQIVRLVLLLTGVGEGLAFVANVFRGRQFAERNGRPYDPAYHGMMQDFGFYNLAMALLLFSAAADPVGHTAVVRIVLVLYVVHGGTHLLRYAGLYYGGERSIPTRPPHFELRDGMQLLLPATAIVLFFSHLL